LIATLERSKRPDLALGYPGVEPPFRLEIDVEGAGPLPGKEALALLKKAAEGDSGDPDYHYILGGALARLGRNAEALASLREAARRRPDHLGFQRNLGLALRQLGKAADAAQCFRAIAQRHPESAEAHMDLAAARQPRRDAREALLLERVLAEVKVEKSAAQRGLHLVLDAASGVRSSASGIGLPLPGRAGTLVGLILLLLLLGRTAWGLAACCRGCIGR
jgi:tetratricopeptide (TPR) repeat protein